jgi:hypothetical protein
VAAVPSSALSRERRHVAEERQAAFRRLPASIERLTAWAVRRNWTAKSRPAKLVQRNRYSGVAGRPIYAQET